MKTPEQLDDFLADVLYEALPKGMYRFWDIPNPLGHPAKVQLATYLTNWQKTQQQALIGGSCFTQPLRQEPLELNAIANWKTCCQAKFEEWSHFGPGPAASPDSQAKFDQLAEHFLGDLEALLTRSKLRGSYILKDRSHYNTSWYLGYAPWSDQLNCDILLDTEIALYVMHYGWSS